MLTADNGNNICLEFESTLIWADTKKTSCLEVLVKIQVDTVAISAQKHLCKQRVATNST
jgi:hypothetical protein